MQDMEEKKDGNRRGKRRASAAYNAMDVATEVPVPRENHSRRPSTRGMRPTDDLTDARKPPTGHLGLSHLFCTADGHVNPRHHNSIRWQDMCVAVSKTVRTLSGSEQLGLFYQRDLPQGSVVGLYGDILIPAADFANQQSFPIFSTLLANDMRPSHMPGWVICPALNYWMRTHPGVTPTSERARRFSLMVLANEAPEPTATTQYSNNMAPFGATINGRKAVIFVTTRDVAAGEEAFWYYGDTFNRSGWGGTAKGNAIGHMSSSAMRAAFKPSAYEKRVFKPQSASNPVAWDEQMWNQIMAYRIVQAGMELPSPDDQWTCTSFQIAPTADAPAPSLSPTSSHRPARWGELSEEERVAHVMREVEAQTGMDLSAENRRMREAAAAAQRMAEAQASAVATANLLLGFAASQT